MNGNAYWIAALVMVLVIGLVGFILPPDKPKNGGDACGSDHKKAHC